MDSPFGALDPTYRRHIAEHLNMLADQVVLLLTKTQWRGEVETALQNKVSRQYVITYNTPRDDVEPDYLTIEGQRFELVRESPNEFEFSTIQPA